MALTIFQPFRGLFRAFLINLVDEDFKLFLSIKGKMRTFKWNEDLMRPLYIENEDFQNKNVFLIFLAVFSRHLATSHPSFSDEGGITFLEIKGVQFFWIELKPVMRVSAIANLKFFKHKVLYAGSCRLPWRTFKKLHTSLDHHQSPFSAGPTQGATHLAKHQINSLLQDSLHKSCSTAVGP